MNVRSLFSGVGGLDLGLERAGLHVVSQCEKDPWRRRVLKWHWPGVHLEHDVAAVTADALPTGLEQPQRPDVLCGGFPCQDLSVAGRRAGLNGDRSGLFFEFARIADELRPRWLLVENVPGLLSSADGRDFAVVLSTLAGLGYGVAWRTLDARYFGVPQRRRRVFIVGHLGDDPEPALRALGAGGSGDLEAGDCSWQRTPARARGGTIVPPLVSGSSRGKPTPLSPGFAGADGHIVVSALDRQAGGPDDNAAQAGHLIAAPLTRGSATGEGVNQPGRRQEDDITLASDPITLASDPISALPQTKRNGDPGVVQRGSAVRRLTPVECERLMSWPDGWTAVDGPKTPDSRRYAACGDGVVSNVAEWIGRRIIRVAFDEGER